MNDKTGLGYLMEKQNHENQFQKTGTVEEIEL